MEVIVEIEKGTIVKETFGHHTWQRYSEAKRSEWDMYRTYVTDWEIERYLSSV